MKKKVLPKDFEHIMRTDNIYELEKLFESYDINACCRYDKTTALHLCGASDEVTKWLIEHGADLYKADNMGATPLHNRSRYDDISFLVNYYEDVNIRDKTGATPLHFACEYKNIKAIETLIEKGADIRIRGGYWKRNVIEACFAYCSNNDMGRLALTAWILIENGAKVSETVIDCMDKIDINFKRYRQDFEGIKTKADYGMTRVYEVIKITEPHKQHNGEEMIKAEGESIVDIHERLWHFLVPFDEKIPTLQGEAIDITAELSYEIKDNLCFKWGLEHNKKLVRLLRIFASGNAFDEETLKEAKEKAKEASKVAVDRLSELAVEWVIKNPKPLKDKKKMGQYIL